MKVNDGQYISRCIIKPSRAHSINSTIIMQYAETKKLPHLFDGDCNCCWVLCSPALPFEWPTASRQLNPKYRGNNGVRWSQGQWARFSKLPLLTLGCSAWTTCKLSHSVINLFKIPWYEHIGRGMHVQVNRNCTKSWKISITSSLPFQS